MKAEAFLEDLRQMPLISPDVLTEGKPFLVLSPHPDDESLGVGGLIAAACAADQRVDIVVLTDGSGSHTQSKMFPREKLIALRKQEAARAAAHLGLPEHRLTHFDLPDAHVRTEGEAFVDAVGRLIALIDAAGAAALFVTWGRDPHCDHEAADAMARAVRRQRPKLKLWSYPIWGWHISPTASVDEPSPRGFRIDITPWLPQKLAAIEAHASQMTDLIDDDPEGFRFDETTIKPFIGPFEYVFEVPA